jgi:hypothetical protein
VARWTTQTNPLTNGRHLVNYRKIALAATTTVAVVVGGVTLTACGGNESSVDACVERSNEQLDRYLDADTLEEYEALTAQEDDEVYPECEELTESEREEVFDRIEDKFVEFSYHIINLQLNG